MTKQANSNARNDVNDLPRAYATPRLSSLGQVRDVTESGSMAGEENKDMIGPNFMV